MLARTVLLDLASSTVRTRSSTVVPVLVRTKFVSRAPQLQRGAQRVLALAVGIPSYEYSCSGGSSGRIGAPEK